MYIHIEVLVGKCGCYSSDFQDMLYIASRKQCYVSPLENNAMSLSKILIVSPLYMTMTVLTMVYGAVAIASDCANLKKITTVKYARHWTRHSTRDSTRHSTRHSKTVRAHFNRSKVYKQI